MKRISHHAERVSHLLPKTKHPLALKPFFGFYGGKWRDALDYPLPLHRTVVEPFAGSAGYSVRHYWKRVVLCEIDPQIAGVWRFLVASTPKDILAIPDLEAGESVDDLNVCQEAKWLVGFWLNRGVAGPRKKPSRWMREKIRPGSFWGDRVRNTIASQVDLIKHWKVHECTYEECPVTRPATWFIDPPYEYAGRYYRFNSSQIDYKALRGWCKARIGQVIVCENEGADWLPFRRHNHTKTTRRGRRSREVIWYREAQKLPKDE